VFSVGPLAQGGLDETFGVAVGSRGIRPGAMVFELAQRAGVPELAGAITGAIVGQQSADRDAVSREEVERGVQKADSSFGFLIGQQLGKGHAGVVVDGDVESQQARMLVFAAQSAVAAQAHLREASHALDVQVQQVPGPRMFVAHDGRSRMQIAPTAEPGAAQDAADRGRGETAAEGDLISGHVPSAQLDNTAGKALRQAARTAVRSRTAIQQSVQACHLKASDPLGGGLIADAEGGCSRLPRPSLFKNKPG